jgi:O-antigen/teichoic acid export membrane protein
VKVQGERSGPLPEGRAEQSRSDLEVQRLAAGGGLNIAAGLVNQGCLFGVTILLARQLGSSDVGTYAQAFAIRQLLVLVALGGMRSAMTRYVAIHRADDDPAALRGTIRFGLAFTVGTSLVFGVALFAASHWLAFDAFNDPGMESALRWVAVGLPSACFVVATLSATQGFRTQRPFAFVGNMLEPILRLVLTVGVLAAGFGLNGALIVLQVASVVTAVAAFVWLRKLMAQHPRVTPRYEVRVVMRYASVSWLSSVAQQGLVWSDIIILGLFLAPSEVGVYQVATRIVLIGGIASQALNASLAPRAADLFRRGQLETLSRLYVASSEWLVRLSLPLLAFLFVCTEPILRLFGPEFVVGVAVTRILIIGTLIDAGTTQGGILLNMSGRNAMNMFDTVGALVINLGLNVLLIPSLGIRGASLAWAVSLLVIGVLRAVQVHHFVVPAYPLSWRVLKSAGAAVLAVAVGWPLLEVLPSTWGFLVVGLVMASTYLTCLWGLGMEDDDRLVLESLVARVRPARGSV